MEEYRIPGSSLSVEASLPDTDPKLPEEQQDR